ncbi:hypothetical protein CONPUDRAFT_126779 [Coniophora puteana RWD-64-598 SS2]|uniref:Smr domain-containing protein n=1 Tax=Coniophora puteana (strain RWD-64-598) TaxID=741705 RepID=A0A5M3MIS5_CONPW|nr:uncharacterized protein CONPUDRAFT_126779 [Coniophora puteana RWD-64-598 SS2]EIW79013.1 hypothetical protein CONPUDRAFT_126779 [Coniophora puteana RWD-64-598 SS2]
MTVTPFAPNTLLKPSPPISPTSPTSPGAWGNSAPLSTANGTSKAQAKAATFKQKTTATGYGYPYQPFTYRSTAGSSRAAVSLALRKRDDLLREASRAWRGGGGTGRHGGEVALALADRAREYGEIARLETLERAREMVLDKRATSTDKRTIDLHGTCVSEAVTIVRDILASEECSASKPLRIITGRGTHSVNGVGVLKPAVKNALIGEGWSVGIWDGGLVVRGRSRS